MTIPTNLIERALRLTGKTMEDMCNKHGVQRGPFSIEKFSYFLLSPEFIEKYRKIYEINGLENAGIQTSYYTGRFGNSIHEYQSGNPGPLIDLLTKIPGQSENT